MLMSRTEELLQSKKTFNPSRQRFPAPESRNYFQTGNEATAYPDVSDALKFRTESLLHSKTRRKKRKAAPKESVVIQVRSEWYFPNTVPAPLNGAFDQWPLP